MGTGNGLADGSSGEEQIKLFQPSLCDIFIARDPRPDAQGSAGSPGASAELPQWGALLWPPGWWWPSAGEAGPSVMGPCCTRHPGGGRQGPQQPLNPPGGLGGGNEPFQGPTGVQEAAPALPGLYLGQAALGSALKCEAASLSIAGGKK